MNLLLKFRKICILLLFTIILNSLFFATHTIAKEDGSTNNGTNTEIPKIFLNGDIFKMNSKSDKRKVLFRYEDNAKNFEGYAKLRLQGSASLNFEKKNYIIDFYENDNYQSKKNIDFGWGEHSRYTLKADWADKTHARNIVTANIMAEINKKYGLFSSAPNYGETDGFPVEVYVDNNFLGLYALDIPKSEWMFGMDENSTQNILFSSDGWGGSNLFKTEIGFDDAWDFEIGEDEGYAVSQLNKVVYFITSSTDQEFKENLEKYFNLDNLFNYYVMVEFADLIDNVGKNILIGSYDNGEHWFLGLYDLNLSWGSFFGTLNDYEASSGIENNLLFKRLRENFPNELADRYFALRKTILTKEHILEKFYQFENMIPQTSLEKDKEKWGESIGHDISQIEDFLDARIPFTDQLFYDFYTIQPEVRLRYENSKDGTSVKVIPISNREDIIIDGPENSDQEFIFSKNGVYKISCRDWFNNFSESYNIEITSIKDDHTNTPPLYLIVCSISSLCCILIVLIYFRIFLKFKR